MARGDATFFRVNCDWDENPLCKQLSHVEYRINQNLWGTAVKLRMTSLSGEYDPRVNPKHYSTRCRTRPEVIVRSVRHMVEMGLYIENDDNSLTVCGVRKNNSKIKWKDDPYGDKVGESLSVKGKGNNEKESETTQTPKGAAVDPVFVSKAKEIGEAYSLIRPEGIAEGVKAVGAWFGMGAKYADMLQAVKNYAESKKTVEVKYRKMMKGFFADDEYWKDWVKNRPDASPPIPNHEKEINRTAVENAHKPEIIANHKEAFLKKVNAGYENDVDFPPKA